MNFDRLVRMLGLSLSSVVLASQIAFAQQPAAMPETDAADTATTDTLAGEDPDVDLGDEAGDEADEAALKTAATQAANAYKVYTHTATISNGAGSYVTYLDDPMLNGHPEAIVLATANWNPPGSGGIYNNHPIGVWFNPISQRWSVFNEDIASIPDGASFNIRIGSGFLHQANNSNIVGHWTVIDNPAANNNPTAKVSVTPVWVNGVGAVYETHPIGVWYDGSHWAIYNQDIAPMPNKTTFFVVIGEGFVHKAVASNISGHVTYIDNAQCNGKPEARLIVTPNFNPSGQGNVYENHDIGVWYDGSRWSIFNQDFAPMPTNASFNVIVVNSPKVTSAHFMGRKLIVEGENFGNGAVVMVNGLDRLTQNDTVTPTSKLIVRKAAKAIPVGTQVTIEVRNADGLMSDSMSYTR